MADNIDVTPGSGKTIAADDIAGVMFQRVKIGIGSDGSATDLAFGQSNKAGSIPVVLAADQGIIQVSSASGAFDVTNTFTRPADTIAYAAGDVVGGALTFSSIGPGGGSVMITGTQLEIDVSAMPAGMSSFRLYLYGVTPPSALADNAAWDLVSGDRASFLGYVDLGTPADLGSTLYVEMNNLNKQIKMPASGSLFAYLVTNGAHTPSSASVHKVTLHAQAV